MERTRIFDAIRLSHDVWIHLVPPLHVNVPVEDVLRQLFGRALQPSRDNETTLTTATGWSGTLSTWALSPGRCARVARFVIAGEQCLLAAPLDENDARLVAQKATIDEFFAGVTPAFRGNALLADVLWLPEPGDALPDEWSP